MINLDVTANGEVRELAAPLNRDVLDGDEILEELREMIEARRLAKASINGAPFGSIIKVIQTMALDLAQERQRARAYLDCLQPE